MAVINPQADVLSNALQLKQFKESLAKIDHAVESYTAQIDNSHIASLARDRQSAYKAAKNLSLEIKRSTLEHRSLLLTDMSSIMKSIQEYRTLVHSSPIGTPIYNTAIQHLVQQLTTDNFARHIGEYGYGLDALLKVGIITYSKVSGARVPAYTTLTKLLQGAVKNWMKATNNFTLRIKRSQTEYIHEAAVSLTLFRQMYVEGPARRDQAALAERTKVIRNGYTKDNCNRYASQTKKVGETLNNILKVVGDYVKQNISTLEVLDKIVNDIIFLISKN